MTPDMIAELRRLHSEWQETVNPYGFRLMPSGEYYTLVAAAMNALPALLDAADERDALAAKVERVRDWLDHRGVDASDRDGAYMDGYRTAQRHMVLDAAELRAALDEGAQP